MKYHLLFILLLIVPIHSSFAIHTFQNLHVDNSAEELNGLRDKRGILARSDRNQLLLQDEKNLSRTERRIMRFQKIASSEKFRKRMNGLNDPVNKWFWFWIIGWSAGLLISLLAGGSLAGGGIGIIWFTLFVLGSISLVIWLLKKFQ